MNYQTHEDDSPENARITQEHPLMFPRRAREICKAIGLAWRAVLKLREEGWISFDPEQPEALGEAQEAELRFIGNLVVAGCDSIMLTRLLSGLRKPYQYRGEWLYYDWTVRGWRLLPPKAPLEPDTEDDFVAWVQELIDQRDTLQLEMIADDAIRALRKTLRPKGKAAGRFPSQDQSFPGSN